MKTFLISDTHFGHANILTFKDEEGNFIRPGFKDIKEHDQILIDNWNNVVSNHDKIYHLGDIGLTSFSYTKRIFDSLKGEKILIKGNHDGLKLSQYAQMFKDVRAYHVLDKFLLSHIPIHPDSLSRWKANIHGHVHAHSLPDSNYYNVSVEVIKYTPIEFEEIRKFYEA